MKRQREVKEAANDLADIVASSANICQGRACPGADSGPALSFSTFSTFPLAAVCRPARSEAPQGKLVS